MRMALYRQIGVQVPETIHLLPKGEVTLGDGRQPFLVTPESLKKIMAAWRLRGNDMVIDYEHQTTTGGEAPAAGWVKELYSAADGLWARVVWTDRAKDYLEKREYRYFSPVVKLGEGRVAVDLLHVALTNFPAMTNLPPLMLQHQGLVPKELQTEIGQEGRGAKAGKKSQERESRHNRGEKMILEELCKIFGLQDDVSEEEILTLAHDLVNNRELENQKLPWEIMRSLGLAEADSTDTVVERIAALKADAEDAALLREEISLLKEKQSVFVAERLIQEALSSKKTTPAELDLANGRLRQLAQDDPDFFRELILARPDNWAVPGSLGVDNRDFPRLSHEERTICETFGITPEAFLKNRLSFETGE